MFLYSKIKENQRTTALFNAINKLGFAIYQELAKDETNVFFCPPSLFKTLSIVFSGTSGETADEMNTFLGSEFIDFTHDEITECFELLIDASDKISKTLFLKIIDVVLIKETFDIKEEYEKTIKECFRSIIRKFDFTQESSYDELNSWINRKTKGMIPKLMDSADSNAIMIIINCVCFKGPWMKKFVKKKTYNHPFHSRGGGQESAIGIDFMHLIYNFRFVEEATFKALEMPYAGEEISMLVLLPRDYESFTELEKELCPDFIKDLKSKLVAKEVKVGFPKIEMQIDHAMRPSLESLGLRSIFKRESDFSGICDDTELMVSDIYLKAYLTVNEEGSVATLSAASVGTSTLDLTYEAEFLADQPFIFIVYNLNTELIIFMGKIMKYPLKT